ncbi:hypothetical protein ACWDSF_06165 [Nocardia beijingensis]
MTEPNFELSFLETSAREADAEGRTLVIDPGYVFEALEKLAEARARVAELEAAQRPPLGCPTPAEIAELRAATLYSYEAGSPNLESITSDWVRGVVSQADGGLVDVIDTLARLVGGEVRP